MTGKGRRCNFGSVYRGDGHPIPAPAVCTKDRNAVHDLFFAFTCVKIGSVVSTGFSFQGV